MKRFFRKLRRFLRERKQIKTGGIYHHHGFDIIVTRDELSHQLRNMHYQYNLLWLLVFGKSLPSYEIWLAKVSCKFELIGSFLYPISKMEAGKPDLKFYIHELFQGYYETLDEVKEHIESLTGTTVDNEYARSVFRKLIFIIYTCCPLMADSSEVWWENTYRPIIEYAIESDDFDIPDCDNIWDAFLDRWRSYEICQTRKMVLDTLPEDVAKEIISGGGEDNLFRW